MRRKTKENDLKGSTGRQKVKGRKPKTESKRRKAKGGRQKVEGKRRKEEDERKKTEEYHGSNYTDEDLRRRRDNIFGSMERDCRNIGGKQVSYDSGKKELKTGQSSEKYSL